MEHSYTVTALQNTYPHLKDLLLLPVRKAMKTLLNIGSDLLPHILITIQSICKWLIRGPTAVHNTQLGWSLQGKMDPLQPSWSLSACDVPLSASLPDDLKTFYARFETANTFPAMKIPADPNTYHPALTYLKWAGPLREWTLWKLQDLSLTVSLTVIPTCFKRTNIISVSFPSQGCVLNSLLYSLFYLWLLC